jgi:hypothetical protein
MPSPFEPPARAPMWIAGISIGLLAASGLVAIVRSIPPSYANVPDEEHRAASRGSEDLPRANDLQTQLEVVRPKVNRRSAMGCDECGIVESMREIKWSGDAGRRDTGVAVVGGRVPSHEPDRVLAATSKAETRYEFTVRFRDGSNKVFNDTSPRAWPLGSRVIVIGRANAPAN